MRKKIPRILVLLIFSIGVSCSQSTDNLYEEFNHSIGPEKAEILKSAIKSFDKFLILNFPDEKSENNRIIRFLNAIQENEYEIYQNWTFNAELDKNIIEEFEKSGLRKDVWMYGYELLEYDKPLSEYYRKNRDSLIACGDLGSIPDSIIDLEFIPIVMDSLDNDEIEKINIEEKRIKNSIEYDTTRFATPYPELILIINELEIKDSLLINYLDAKRIAGSLSMSILIRGLLYENEKRNYTNPLMKTIIIIELYYWIMEWGIKNTQNK